MANANVYSGKEFSIYIAPETTVGTFVTTAGNYKKVDVDSVSFPSWNIVQEFEMRSSGSGRVAKSEGIFTTEKNVVREISIAGRLDPDVLTILAQNVTGQAVASDEVALSTGHTPATIEHDDAGGDVTQTLSVSIDSPITASSYALAGCIVTNFQITGEMESAGGRLNFSATLQTGYDPQATDIVHTQDMSSTRLFLSDMDEITIGVAGAVSPIVNSFGLTFDAPAKMLGITLDDNSNPCPQVIAKQIPEFNITYSMGMKFDSDTDGLIENFRDGDDIEVYIANDAETVDTFPAGATLFGVDINHSRFTNAEVDTGDVAGVNVEGKVVDNGTDEIISVLVA